MAPELHLALDKIVYFMALFMTILAGWIGKFLWSKLQEFEDHKRKCNENEKKEIGTDTNFVSRLRAIEMGQENLSMQMSWLGDCTLIIGTTTQSKLPPRPYLPMPLGDRYKNASSS